TTKICVMNCGPHAADPRTEKERKLLCDECAQDGPPAKREPSLTPDGFTYGYRCIHDRGYKCAICYAQPGEVPYL
ncbi:MAG: hypothetical protein RR740_26510, partial [Pseudomonas sp.]